MSEFPVRLKECRKTKGLTQKEAAEICDILPPLRWWEYVTSTDFVLFIDVAKPTAMSLIRQLKNTGILKEIEA